MKQTNVKPADGKLGIMVVGCGAVATTFMTGVFMARKGLAKPVGSMTQYDKIRVGRGADKKYLHYKDIVALIERNKDNALNIASPTMISVALRETDVMIGEIVVMPNEGTISLGYTFSYKVHRSGYAYEALSSLIEYLHKHYPQWDFICFTERENIPSMSLLKKLGYTNLGYLPSKNSQVFGKWLRQDTLEEITSAVR